MARHAHLGEGLQAHLQLGELRVLGLGLAPPPAHIEGGNDDKRKQPRDRKAGKNKQYQGGVERDAPHANGVKSHAD